MPIYIKNNKLYNNKVLYKEVLLSDYLSTVIDSKLLNQNPTTSKPIFSTLNHATSTYVRNTNCWINPVDITGIGVWNSLSNGGQRGFSLISPRHIIMATHYPLSPNNTLRFVTNDNTVITRTITNRIDFPATFLLYPDISIGLLNSDVPSSIKPLKFLPSNIVSKISIQNAAGPISTRFPVFVTDQAEQALILDWIGNIISTNGNGDTGIGFRIDAPISSTRIPFYEQIISGDSGSPMCFIINNELVIASAFTSALSGSWYTHHLQQINDAMTTLGGGYQLSTINLDNFRDI